MMPGATKYGHSHAEAFSRMQYECKGCGHVEWLYNTRDGVTPFGVDCVACGGEALHARWNEDRYQPDYDPPPGSRIFVDMTPEIAAEQAKPYAESMWNHPAYPAREHGTWETVEEMADYFAAEWCKTPGNPALITVPTPSKPEPRGHFCLVHGREHPEGWTDDCVSERDQADGDALAADRRQPREWPHLTVWQRALAAFRCAKRGHHDWAEDGDTLGGIWIRCRDCRTLEEFLPGLHEPKGGEQVWQARLDEARRRARAAP